MADFFEKEKDKIVKEYHEHKAHEEKKLETDTKAEFYKNENTGAIISREQYMNMKYEQELEMNNIMQPNLNGINNVGALMEEDVVSSEDGVYVPYFPSEED